MCAQKVAVKSKVNYDNNAYRYIFDIESTLDCF